MVLRCDGLARRSEAAGIERQHDDIVSVRSSPDVIMGYDRRVLALGKCVHRHGIDCRPAGRSPTARHAHENDQDPHHGVFPLR